MLNAWYEWLQSGSLVALVVGGLLGYGRLQQQVTINTSQHDKHVTKGELEPFAAEVLRRLERIEAKQDNFINGR